MKQTPDTNFTQPLQDIFGDNGGSFPLIVGMTGHRRIFAEDVAELKSQTTQFFETLWDNWKKTHQKSPKTPPMIVLCGMAEGADMLVAETVLELKSDPNEMNIDLIAVLPMRRELYEEDFLPGCALEEGALDRFRRLTEQAKAVIELPTEEPLDKTKQYENLGLYLARQSFILLALCEEDTGETPKRGGSADVIAMKLDGVRANSTFGDELLDFNCVGPVFQLITRQTTSKPVNEGNLFHWIACERQHPCDGDGDSKPVSKTKSENLESVWKGLSGTKKIIQKIAQLNVDLFSHAAMIEQKLTGKHTEIERLFLEHEDDDIRFLGRHYVACDALAGHFQDKNNKSINFYWLWLTIVGCLASFCLFTYWLKGPGLQICPTVFGSNVLLLVACTLYSVCALGIIIHWFRHQWHGFYSNHHAYRSIAEGLRIQIFWRLAEIDDSVAAHYLSHQIGELDWLRIILRTMMLPLKQTLPNTGAGIKVVQKMWIRDQKNYFQEKFHALTKKSRGLRRFETPWILVPVALWAAFKIWDSTINLWWCEQSHRNSLYLTAVMLGFAIISVVVAAALSYNRIMGYSQNAARYYRMVPMFVQASELLDQLNTTGKLGRQRKVIRELGREALAENAEWLLQQQELDLLK